MTLNQPAILAAAKILQTIRECQAGDVPCPFCTWEYHEGCLNDEMGCIYIAESVLNAYFEHLKLHGASQ